jgi:tetratricopeptide (TPR) repeat protein
MKAMRSSPGHRLAAFAAGVVLSVASPAGGVTHLERGVEAPPVALPTIRGTSTSLQELRGRTVVLVFGELYHEKTLLVCGEIRNALAEDPLAGQIIAPVLVVARDAPESELAEQARDPRLPRRILLDRERAAYGAYRVSVMPSCVVIDANGRVVHAVAGYTSRLADILADAMLVAVGDLAAGEFDRRLRPGPDGAPDESVLRASRIESLARQLVRRGLNELAEEKYREALALAPEHVPARLGLGMLLLERRQLAAAEEQYRAVLAADEGSTDATLGLAYIQTLRGGAELEEAERTLRGVLVANPAEARAHYLIGLIHQDRGEHEAAGAAFRKAAELLMSRRDAWSVNPGKHDDRTSEQRPR